MGAGNGLCAVVLAAGRSTRMQEKNKLLLPWGDGLIVQAAIEALLSASFAAVVVVVGHQREQVGQALADYPVRLVHNPAYAQGLSTSIACGVEAVREEVDGYLFALGDMPRVKPQTIGELCRAFSRGAAGAIALPTRQGRRGNPVVFAGTYRAELLRLEGDRGAKPLVQKYADEVIEVGVEDAGILVDVDTPAAYRSVVDAVE